MDERMNRMKGWIGWMNEWMNNWMDGCINHGLGHVFVVLTIIKSHCSKGFMFYMDKIMK